MQHQRQTFDEERTLWNIERTELYEKIAQLQQSLRRYRAFSAGHETSPIPHGDIASQGNSSFRSLPSKDGSNRTNAIATGHEIWRGSQPDVQPTRTFSDPMNHFTKPGDRSRLPSIAENTTCGRKDSSDGRTELRKSSVSGAEIDRNLDGINFKLKALSPVSAKKIMTPQSPSPRTSSPSHPSPKTIELPPSELHASLDPYIKDAGHTPLARRTYFHADGLSGDDNGATPTQPEIDRPPLEPHASFAKTPSERSDSYFPIPDDEPKDKKDKSADQEGESPDEDPELKGPLALDNSEGLDNPFLQEVNSKLRQITGPETSGPPSIDLDAEASPLKDGDDEFEQPEPEPKLRIKRSMNFGSAFGARTCGKGI